MPRAAPQTDRFALRLSPEEKAKLLRAAALEHVDLKTFLLRHAGAAADAVLDRAERLELSARDSQRVLALLDAPAQPNERLVAAARGLLAGR